METTSRSNRKYIGLVGRRNVGKSTILNILTGQETSIVSDYAGTTTDVVQKNMELHDIGSVVFLDTAGYDDIGNIGKLRIEKTEKSLKKLDIALLIIEESLTGYDREWVELLNKNKVKYIPIVNKNDIYNYDKEKIEEISKELKEEVIIFSEKENKELILNKISENLEEKEEFITGDLVKKDTLVLLVMPQDKEAPKGRLILPQVQTIRELIDKHAVTISISIEEVQTTLNLLNKEPDLIITDSKVFEDVYKMKPKNSELTSFSVLFAALKGDIEYFIESAERIPQLNKSSKILIAEACTHPPISEDIGTVRIPEMLRKKYGENINIDFVRGDDFPKDLSRYDLIIHCGACMFNKKHVQTRVEEAKRQNIPMTNYGVTIAKLKGILDKVIIP
ncbi:[FeFe] hydrogenase H-cluster maturation GTPase HydF [Miniphocaeibacter massiliensis]|uniref:[FeFe] hydrogenase H-cluster maturation GTPase HydF n=1 Tax=Miniphocaeibacter massiliensis TaxID=2041841 RepID=UPI000C1C463B|nr:[FeFe] hydrogenase H-cluster maturation GTPase HydF [Miniphocaeibacter massiliensis]